MRRLPPESATCYTRRLQEAHVPQMLHPHYHKRVGLFIHFCEKYDFPPTAPTALGPFLTKLAAKGYSIEQRHHAAAAVRLLVRADRKDPALYIQLSSENRTLRNLRGLPKPYGPEPVFQPSSSAIGSRTS